MWSGKDQHSDNGDADISCANLKMHCTFWFLPAILIPQTTCSPFLSVILMHLFLNLLPLSFYRYTSLVILSSSILSSLTLYLSVAFTNLSLKVLQPMSPLNASNAVYLGAFKAILATLFCPTSSLSISLSSHPYHTLCSAQPYSSIILLSAHHHINASYTIHS